MKVGKLVGPRALCPAESNMWDMSQVDKKSYTRKSDIGEHASPSATSAPRARPDVQISSLRIQGQLHSEPRQFNPEFLTSIGFSDNVLFSDGAFAPGEWIS